MEFIKSVEGTVVTVRARGKLDSVGAPEFSQVTDGIAEGMTAVVLDFGDVSYVSSAGLRAVLKLTVGLPKGVEVSIVNASGMTEEVFKMTGFGNLLRDVENGQVD